MLSEQEQAELEEEFAADLDTFIEDWKAEVLDQFESEPEGDDDESEDEPEPAHEEEPKQFDELGSLETDPIASIAAKGASRASQRVRKAAEAIRESLKKK